MIEEKSKVPNRQYEVVSADGEISGPFNSIIQAYAYAQEKWPGQEQDDMRTGRGWDVQLAGYGL